MSTPDALQAAFASADTGTPLADVARSPTYMLISGSHSTTIRQRLAKPQHADRDGVISPLEAPVFFRESGLPDDILSLVWQYSTAGNAYNAIVSLVHTPPTFPALLEALHPRA